jgi:hypothetical protein
MACGGLGFMKVANARRMSLGLARSAMFDWRLAHL